MSWCRYLPICFTRKWTVKQVQKMCMYNILEKRMLKIIDLKFLMNDHR